MRKRFWLKRIKRKKGFIYLYRLNRESGIVDRDEKTFHVVPAPPGYSPATSKVKAELYVNRLIKEKERKKQKQCISGLKTFREYAEPYFVWGTCPRVERKLDERKTIGKTHVKKSRRWLEKYVFDDPFALLMMDQIKRADILDLRKRLKQKTGINTVNKVVSTVKTVLSEAYFRNDIDYNPGSQIGNINYDKREKGILTQEELHELFNEIPGHWSDLRTYCVFNTAAKTGMRCGEVLALMWSGIDFSEYVFDICQAWSDRSTLGLPKSRRKRRIPVVFSVIEPLKLLHEESIRISSTDLVFCYDDGSRLGATWWRKNFCKTLVRAGLAVKEPKQYRDKKGRKRVIYKYKNKRGKWITPHSLRHSLNSHLLSAGCDILKVRAYLGWSDNIRQPVLTPVQQGYTHWLPEHLRDLLPAIEGVFAQTEARQ